MSSMSKITICNNVAIHIYTSIYRYKHTYMSPIIKLIDVIANRDKPYAFYGLTVSVKCLLEHIPVSELSL